MPEPSDLEIPPPKDWQCFERWACDLFSAEWKTQAKMHGRTGQPQHGVDIYGQPEGSREFQGVQCKKKDQLAGSNISADILRREVKKAKAFTPPLARFILASTGPRDASVQRIARQLSQENQAQGLFSVEVMFWDDFLDMYDRHEEVFSQHYGGLLPEVRIRGGAGEMRSATFMFDEAHGQERWRHLSPTIGHGYSAAHRALLPYGTVTTNKGSPFSHTILKKCCVLILPMPFGILVEPTEYEALAHWVNQGGRLLISGFYFMEAHIYTNFSSLANRLQMDFGRNLIMPRGRISRDDQNEQAFPVRRDLCALVKPCSSDPGHPIMKGVEKIALQSSCTVRSCAQAINNSLEIRTDKSISLLTPARGELNPVVPYKFDIIYKCDVDNTKQAVFAVACSYGKGCVVATGSWRMFINDYFEDRETDNDKLFLNSVRWLLGDTAGTVDE